MKRLTTPSALAALLLAALPGQAQESAPAAPAAAGTPAETPAETPPALGLSGGHGRKAFMATYDTDGDGSVTRADYFALRRARFATADINGDKVLDKAEYLLEFQDRLDQDYAAQHRARDRFYAGNIEQTMNRFDLLDLNKDGKMDESEFYAQAEKTFGRVDTNGDGVANADDPEPERRPQATEAPFAGAVEFKGRLSAAGPDGAPVWPGTEVTVSGRGLAPGQKVALQRGAVALTDDPVTVGEDGNFRASFTLPDTAAPGLYPVFVIGEGPDAVTTLDVKISPRVALSGADQFPAQGVKGPDGLYQSAYSAGTDTLFVTATAFGGPGGGAPASVLAKVSPETLETLAQVTIPESAPEPAKPVPEAGALARVPAVFGVDVDDAAGTVWVTNTIQGTVAVYRQSDLSLVKQFAPELVRHSREVLVDAGAHRAYVSASASNEVGVFDTEKLEFVDTIRIVSGQRGGEFTAMGLALDEGGHRLYVSSRTSNELAEIDTATGAVLRVLTVPGAKNSAGIAFGGGRVLIASQDSDDLIAVDAATGEVAFRTPVGAGALAVAVSGDLAFVASRGAGTVTVVDGAGKVVANLDAGSYPNHVEAGAKGQVFVVNKSRGPDDATGDHLTRLR
ncbi:MAG: hypothetical protein QM656_05995 [Paracoccaceae bacterium]